MADQGPKNGRSRGRAKGRGRPPQAAQATRPGEQPQQQPAAMGAAAAAAAPAPASMGTGGRQVHRGVPRSDTQTRSAEQEVAQRMQSLSLQPERGAVARPERPPLSFEVVRTRPEHLQSKQVPNTLRGYGTAIDLTTNYFFLESRPKWRVYQYHVDFSPVVESSRMRRAMLGDHRGTLGQCYLFDGMSGLKSVIKLDNEVTELYSCRRTDNEQITITIKRTNELAPDDPQLGHLFNTQMRRNLQHLQFKLIGRHYFDKNAITQKESLQLQIWQGVVTSIRMQESRVMMMVDTVHKVVRQQTAWIALKEASVNARKTGATFRDEAAKVLVGAIVMTQYNTRTYRIDDIMWDERPTNRFESKAGEICYLDYYRQQYDIQIGDRDQPLLLCTSKEREIRGGEVQAKKVRLIPELCNMTGLTDEMRSNFTQMKELAAITKLTPEQRVTNLEKFMSRIKSNPDVQREMKAWELQFSKDLVPVTGHVLPSEQIVQKQFKTPVNELTADFSREMRGKPMDVSKNLCNWLLICGGRDHPNCRDFVQTLQKVCRAMQMDVAEPTVCTVANDRIGTYTQTFMENLTSDTQMVVFVLPNNKKDRYDALKKLTCVDHPVPSQVILGKTLSKKQMLMSVSTKIGIQLNCKLGGEPWSVEIPFSTRTMIVGYDTYHDAINRSKSAGGFVASMNQKFTRWYSQVNFHSRGITQELSDHLFANLTAALRKYQEYNKAIPQLIIFYRDGVGDGDIQHVRDYEVQQVVKCIKQVLKQGIYNPEKEPQGMKLAFIVVNKKISTRFFAKERGKPCNPQPGTCVDDVVTRYERYDFFLVSQSVRQGTVAPTMYNIIMDASGFSPVHMQRLAYKLTHLYFNWQGTVRVPAPCQYAHKLAFLAGQSLHRAPDERLANTLFYL